MCTQASRRWRGAAIELVLLHWHRMRNGPDLPVGTSICCVGRSLCILSPSQPSNMLRNSRHARTKANRVICNPCGNVAKCPYEHTQNESRE